MYLYACEFEKCLCQFLVSKPMWETLELGCVSSGVCFPTKLLLSPFCLCRLCLESRNYILWMCSQRVAVRITACNKHHVCVYVFLYQLHCRNSQVLWKFFVSLSHKCKSCLTSSTCCDPKILNTIQHSVICQSQSHWFNICVSVTLIVGFNDAVYHALPNNTWKKVNLNVRLL